MSWISIMPSGPPDYGKAFKKLRTCFESMLVKNVCLKKHVYIHVKDSEIHQRIPVCMCFNLVLYKVTSFPLGATFLLFNLIFDVKIANVTLVELHLNDNNNKRSYIRYA